MAAFPVSLFQNSPDPRRRALISLTPLIDMVFILLVFFMLASSFVDERSISVAASSAGTGGPKGALLVQVRADGLRLGGHAMSLDAIAETVAGRVARMPDQRILVEPAPGVQLQAAVTVLDRLAAAGAQNLSLAGPGER